MQSVIGALRVNLGIDTAAFVDGLKSAEAALKRSGQQLQSIGKTMSVAITAPLTGAGALVLRTAGDFEAGMKRVGAALDETAPEFAALRQAAIDMGRETQFSATQAADAIEVLAKNGLDASQILGGALEGSLSLAAASGTDLATAGDIATDVILQFGKGAAELGQVADQITGVLLASKFGIDDYRLAIGQAGGVVGGLGFSFEEFNTALAATSSLFASGSDAGTSFKTFVTRLVPTSKEAAAAMAELGLKFTDADGNMLAMRDIAEQLRLTLGGLSEEARTEALTTIFGSDAMRTAIGLMNTGAEGMDRLTESIARASAAEQAQARLEGRNGALTLLSSAFEGLQLAIAESGLLDMATGFVTALTDIVRSMGEADPQVLRFGTVLAGLAAAIGPVLVALGLVVSGVAAIGVPVAAAIAGIAALTAAVVAFWPEINAAAQAVQTFVEQVVAWVARIPEAFQQMKDQALGHVRALVEGMAEWFGSSRLGRAVTGVTEAFSSVTGAARQMWNDVVGNSWVPDMVLGVEEWMGRLAQSMPETAGRAVDGVGDAFDSLSGTVGSTMRRATDSVLQGTFKMRDLLRQLAADLARAGLSALGNAAGSALKTAIGGLFSSTAGTAITSASLPPIGAFANGTPSAPGGLAWVGERGPELVDMPRGARVHTSAQSRRMAGGGEGGGAVRIMLDAGLRAEIVGEARGQTIEIVQASQQGPGFAARVAAAGRTADSSRMR